MKLSLAWIFDHIVGSWKDCDVPKLVEAFNKTTAEIEEYYSVQLDLSKRCLVRVIDKKNDATVVDCPELGKSLSLSKRDDVLIGSIYMIAKDKNSWRWAAMQDFGGTQERLLPAFSCPDKQLAGQWKDDIEVEDYIIDIDNKTITHRPDLWGHRGIAREVAAILDLPLIPEDQIIADYKVRSYEHFAASMQDQPFTISNKDPEQCKRFAALYMPDIPYMDSWLWMAHRLTRIDSKPIDALVDLTNYVMFDTSQPLHAFDAEIIQPQKIEPRLAKKGEELVLLDDKTIALTPEDLVISDGKKPLALAGVMGGKETEVTRKTRSVLFEAANFDAVTIRKAAQRHKTRTESSARFEKSLDPNQNTKALKRLLFLLQKQNITFVVFDEIISLGHEVKPLELQVSHKQIEESLGTDINQDFIMHILQILGFGIEIDKNIKQETVYAIQVPTFRSSKDVAKAADVIEEIARFYGFDRLPAILPSLETKPSDIDPILRIRNIKQYVAFAMQCREVSLYPIADNVFLQKIDWQPVKPVVLKNPISEHNTHLVTSLVPHLLKGVEENSAKYDKIRFFEWGRVWQQEDKKTIIESKQLAGVIYNTEPIDFYQIKQELNGLFSVIGIDIEWKKDNPRLPWYHPHQTAGLYYDDYKIGVAGMANPMFIQKLMPGNAFIFQIDGDFILTCKPEQKTFKPLPVYQDTHRDVSMFVPIDVTVADLQNSIRQADERIFDVQLIDFFQKEAWPDKRSITLRFFARDPEKTLTKDEIDDMYADVVRVVQKYGAQVR